MIRSMTAFSRQTSNSKNGRWTIEIRSLNHRFFEYSLKLPSEFYVFEDRVRDLLHAKIARGKISLTATAGFEKDPAKIFSLDEKAAAQYLKAVRKLQKRFHIRGEISVNDLFGLPQLFSVKEDKGLADKRWHGLELAIRAAVVKLVHAKEVEGRQIYRDIKGRLDSIIRALGHIENQIKGRSQSQFLKLKKRLEDLLGQIQEKDERLWREVAFIVDKGDMTEEVVRLKSHMQLFNKRLGGQGQVGREMDFLCQEMHREINTLGAKSQDFDISKEVVFMKGELEKIREQVQNVE